MLSTVSVLYLGGSGANLLSVRSFWGLDPAGARVIVEEPPSLWSAPAGRRRRTLSVVTLAVIVDAERRFEEEKARIEAWYRKVLKSSVEFEKRIRNRWRQKNREKNGRIAGLEARIAELERKLENAKDQSRE